MCTFWHKFTMQDYFLHLCSTKWGLRQGLRKAYNYCKLLVVTSSVSNNNLIVFYLIPIKCQEQLHYDIHSLTKQKWITYPYSTPAKWYPFLAHNFTHFWFVSEAGKSWRYPDKSLFSESLKHPIDLKTSSSPKIKEFIVTMTSYNCNK